MRTISILLLFLLLMGLTAPAAAEGPAGSPKSPWEGKTWFAFGDSITSLGYYIDTVNAELGTSCVKFDHSGYSYPELAQVHKEMTEADFGPDLITLFAGTNDFGHGKPVEEMENSVRVILKDLYLAFPKTQIIVITPLQRNSDPAVHPTETEGLGPNSQGRYLIDYVETIKAVAAELGTPCLDLYACGGINLLNAREKTLNGDGLHPSEEYGKVLGHIIAQFILQYAPMNE